MANSTIQNLKNTLGIGARSNRYKLILNSKGGGPGNNIVNTLVKGANIPGKEFADVEVYVQGKKLTIAGETLFTGTWDLTFVDTEQHTLRKAFLAWMNFIDDFNTNNRSASSAPSYMTDAVLQQLSTKDNSPMATYTIYDLYPKALSESTYSDDTEGLLEFTVTFNYSHWD